MKKLLLVLLALGVAFFAFAGGAQEEEPEEPTPAQTEAAQPEVKNPDTLIYATYGTIDSLDYVKAYDTASWTNMRNIYDTLVFYEGESTSDFVPVLATEVPTLENGGITDGGKTYRFKIREGVKFHSGDTLTPEDVEYTFERAFVTDPDGGPTWIWYYLFLDVGHSRDGDGNIQISFEDIDRTVEVDGDYVVFNLKNPFPPFLGVLSGSWAAIVNKSFVAENGGWDGSADTWEDYNNPPEDEETLWDVADGTGPYRLARWEKGVEMVLERHEDYWGELPALRRGIYRVVEEWSTRKLMLLQGDADIATVDPLYYPEMDQESGLNVYKDLPSLNIAAINFNQEIPATDNPLVYSGQLDGAGIPGDFFAEKDIRLAFSYAWDEQTYIRDITNNTAMDPVTPVPFGLPFKNEQLDRLPYDLDKAEQYFKSAFDGEVWDKGFKLDLLYNTGNEVRETSMKMLAENIMSLNPKFELNVRGVEWSVYVDNVRKRTMPIFFIGWAPDYPDPDNYVHPYLHSSGHFAGRAGYSNPEADRLVEEAAVSLDPDERREMYFRLQEIWVEDAPGIALGQPLSRRYVKDWVKGHYYNPMQSSVFDLLADLRKE